VAASGTNNPACSLVAPCRDFASAITATSAGGEIIVLESGGYGPVTIGKTVSIIASPGIYAGISVFSGSGITINAPGAIVVLRGLSINGQGGSRGIDVEAAARVRIEGCVVARVAAEGINDVAAGSEMVMIDTIVRDNGGSGIVVNASAVLDHVRSEHNVVQGLVLSPASTGTSATVTDSVFVYNVVNGIIVTAAANIQTSVHIDHSVMSNNSGAGFLEFASASRGDARSMLTRNTISHNAGPGVGVNADAPGFAEVDLVENAISNNGSGLLLQGTDAAALAGANTVIRNHTFDVHCDVDHTVFTSGNNNFSALPGNCGVLAGTW